eukprot:2995311-Amphidinium_carterae.1
MPRQERHIKPVLRKRSLQFRGSHLPCLRFLCVLCWLGCAELALLARVALSQVVPKLQCNYERKPGIFKKLVICTASGQPRKMIDF